MTTNLRYMTMALFAAAAITGCKRDEEDTLVPPPPANEEEVITTMILSFDGQAGAADKELRFTDSDGDGGGVPVFELDTLQAASNYNVNIILLNETVSPIDTISNEVLEEGVDHQFFFQPIDANITFAYADTDANGNPISLQTTMACGTASVGSLKVTLRHEPDKTAAGVASGDITNAAGETDIEVTFPVVIE
ncbi:MAG: type 1 periplasmic binding fold superfamily protein [Flavobacteriales bacterium]|nr:type 1 periplasmic binding fold superfamily protein [Flavobacteriales bacterium]